MDGNKVGDSPASSAPPDDDCEDQILPMESQTPNITMRSRYQTKVKNS